MSDLKSVSEANYTVTPHLVVRDAAAASEWYQRAFGAEERGRIPVPGGRFMQVELRFGDSTVMLADEFPELGCSRRGRSGALWGRWPSTPMMWVRCGGGPWRRERRFRSRCRRCFGAIVMGRSSTRSGTDGGSPNTSATCLPTRSGRRQRRCSAATRPDPGQGWLASAKGRVMARFGMVGKLVAHPGRRGELVALLLVAAGELQGVDGCELYVVSQDHDDLDTIWVVEAWRDEAAHRTSLDLPAVRGVAE